LQAHKAIEDLSALDAFALLVIEFPYPLELCFDHNLMPREFVL
jgi:hypothetical protein